MEDLPQVLEGIDTRFIETPRLKQFVRFPEVKNSSIPVVFVHGNFTSGTYFEETILALSQKFYGIAPDLRGYGLTEDKVIDATLGFKDWSMDLNELLETLQINSAHFVGWSMGSGVVTQFLLDYPEKVKTLTLISPVSPFGFGGTKDVKGTPCYDDFAGSGGGTVNPDFVQRIKEHDTSALDPNSPRNVINNFYYKPPFRAKREEDFLKASLLEKVGPDRYPGDFVVSPNWPYVAPGKFGPVNAMSPKYVNLSGIAKLVKKPPILWVRGDSDLIVSDNSFFDFGYLGKLGFVPNYPGEEIYPPQPMVSQTRYVLEQYRENGGKYFEVVVKDAAHSPHIEKFEEFNEILTKFIEENI